MNPPASSPQAAPPAYSESAISRTSEVEMIVPPDPKGHLEIDVGSLRFGFKQERETF
jgi:hypothetical protein